MLASSAQARVQQRRIILGTIFVLIFCTIFLISSPSSSTIRSVRVPKFLSQYTQSSGVSTNSNAAVLSNQEHNRPTSSTPPDASEFTTDLADAKDPCENLDLSDGGKNATSARGTTVLVTGGAGFIGSNLVDRLLTLGYKVRIFDNLYTGFIRNVPLENSNVEFFFGDILDRQALQEAIKGVDYVFHLAAMSKSNALGSWNVLEEARLAGRIKKVVYAASSTYYGNAPPPHKETMAGDFLTPYASSKFEGELQMHSFDQLFGVPTVSTRFFMVYGPRQPTTGAYAIVTGVFAKEAAEGKPLTIEGDGTHARDFIHVRDIVEGLILAQQAPTLHGEVINLGTGSSYSVKDLADLVSNDQVHLPPRKNDLIRTLADTCKMKRLLNFQPKTDFIKEMSYMVQATKEGNVFIQHWFTLARALSVPHLLPAGDPMFSWPKVQNDLDSLLGRLQHLSETLQSGSQAGQLVTVIPLTATGIEASSMHGLRELLLNTVHSLVRYGGVVRYMIAATDDAALETCNFLNLPCLDVRKTLKSSRELVEALLTKGYDVHYATLGNSYASSIDSFFYQNSESTIASADTIRARPSGDFFARNTDATRAAFAKSSHDAGLPNDHHSMLAGKGWPSTSHAAAFFNVNFLCDKRNKRSIGSAFGLHTSSSDATTPSRPAVCTAAHPQLYVAVGCEGKPAPLNGGTNSTVDALEHAGVFHLRRCADKEHCDMQQTLPARWVQKKPDLRTEGDLCA
ncbi:hypothetical protein KVT40_006641 [Elsinoe batatas]|uniref:NAD-dependent epimerase/dehydratase domain-containing protein n=1 Tax=Elsinoe batatas TaxID=2601811 RepID=A0A8K0KX41_9PEZI|nr:hypothetical protein KVT40_006641 [Elsinoe batatas]